MQRLSEAQPVPSVIPLCRDSAPKPQRIAEAANLPLETVPPFPEQTHCPQPEPKYPTGFGTVTFEELYAATSRIVGSTMRDQLGMTNPEDIDDCMQVGYLKVWQQLQKQPDWFAGKPKKYIVQAVVLRSKAQRYAHLRHYRKIVYDADAQAHQNDSGPTISQVETWIDLSQSLQRVAEHATTLDNPIYLLALYTLITDVKTQEVAKTTGHGLSTLTAAKRRVRTTLAKELPDYGTAENGVKPLALPKIRSFQLSQLHKQLITPILLDDGSTYPNSPELRADFSPRRLLLPPPQEIYAPDTKTSESTYETRWRGDATFDELLADPQVRKVAFTKMRSFGYADKDTQDCFQLGTMKL